MGRALEALLEGGQVAKAEGDPGGPDMWARKGVATPPEPLASRPPATPPRFRLAKPKRGVARGVAAPL